MKPLNENAQILPPINDFYMESPHNVQRRIAYTDKCSPVEVWFLIPTYNLNMTVDCIGFALDTFRRFGYNVEIQKSQPVLDDEFIELGNVDKIQMGDLVVQKSSDDRFIHFARVLNPSTHSEGHIILEKLGRLSPQYRKTGQLLKDPSHPGCTLTYYREINLSKRPWIIELLNFHKYLATQPGAEQIIAFQRSLIPRESSVNPSPNLDIGTRLAQIADNFFKK
ncbi:hypothetical protein [Pelagibaculum spongiae]|uniref:Uncharacterized protein n=1 Tax=Pelagibaculum spongiae TaxID=2080658 RepID=A0A2V1H6N4_9GAMM|nr:hypothetical protein [Pelagibaculum spongiae]PVZ72092.1 hypothetical protein DC094_03475 [Pelagibaculum spongiae]